jgi:hypothetical protein
MVDDDPAKLTVSVVEINLLDFQSAEGLLTRSTSVFG